MERRGAWSDGSLKRIAAQSGLEARDAALSILVKDGRMDLAIADATAYSGVWLIEIDQSVIPACSAMRASAVRTSPSVACVSAADAPCSRLSEPLA